MKNFGKAFLEKDIKIVFCQNEYKHEANPWRIDKNKIVSLI